MKKRYIFISLIVVCIVMFIITSFCSFFRVEGDSMNPTLVNNDVVYVRKTKSFKQGDLIAFNYNNKLLVRRVIALEGDKVNIDQNGYIFVNDKKLEESDEIISINQFDDTGWYYDLYMGDAKIKRCEVCGKLIKIKSKTKPEKYCEVCAKESELEKTRERVARYRENQKM